MMQPSSSSSSTSTSTTAFSSASTTYGGQTGTPTWMTQPAPPTASSTRQPPPTPYSPGGNPTGGVQFFNGGLHFCVPCRNLALDMRDSNKRRLCCFLLTVSQARRLQQCQHKRPKEGTVQNVLRGEVLNELQCQCTATLKLSVSFLCTVNGVLLIQFFCQEIHVSESFVWGSAGMAYPRGSTFGASSPPNSPQNTGPQQQPPPTQQYEPYNFLSG